MRVDPAADACQSGISHSVNFMDLKITDHNAIRTIPCINVEMYARRRGWEPHQPYRKNSYIFRGIDLPEIIIPQTNELGDYASVVSKLLTIFAEEAKTNELIIYNKLMMINGPHDKNTAGLALDAIISLCQLQLYAYRKCTEPISMTTSIVTQILNQGNKVPNIDDVVIKLRMTSIELTQRLKVPCPYFEADEREYGFAYSNLANLKKILDVYKPEPGEWMHHLGGYATEAIKKLTEQLDIFFEDGTNHF